MQVRNSLRSGEWRDQAIQPLGFLSASWCFIFLIMAIGRPAEALGDGRGCQCSRKNVLGNQSIFTRKVDPTLDNSSPATFPKANFLEQQQNNVKLLRGRLQATLPFDIAHTDLCRASRPWGVKLSSLVSARATSPCLAECQSTTYLEPFSSFLTSCKSWSFIDCRVIPLKYSEVNEPKGLNSQIIEKAL